VLEEEAEVEVPHQLEQTLLIQIGLEAFQEVEIL
jgi:hypothetical protein